MRCPHCGVEIPVSPSPSDERHESSPELRALQTDYRALCKIYQDDLARRRPPLGDFADYLFLSKRTLKRRLKAAGGVWARDFSTLSPLPEGD